MGQAAEDLAYLEWSQSMPRHEFNPHGYRNDPLWTTRDGKKIRLSKMSNIHIKNCIRLLEKSKVDPYNVVGDHDEFAFTVYQIEEDNRKITQTIERMNQELTDRERLIKE